MTRRNLFVPTWLVCVVGMLSVVAVTTIAIAEPPKDKKPAAAGGSGGAGAGQPQMQLPPGWTEADMQACITAGTPGAMHEFLARGAGKWQGKNSMWMYPGAQPMTSECTSTVTPVMDGRYVRVEIAGEMPGMGPFTGFGIYGFDNVSQKFVSSWIDNMSTGIMNGTGELSPDGKVLTWNFSYHCPIAKKQVTLREVETITGPTT